MRRPGVTFLDVVEAAITIQEAGENPTVDRVRERLGTGSRTTLARHLNQWKVQQGEGVSTQHLPPALVNTVSAVWEGLQAQADQRIAAIQTEAESAQSVLETMLSKTQETLATREKDFKDLKGRYNQQEKTCSELSATVDQFQRKEIQWTEKQYGLEQRLQSQQDENRRVHQALLSTQKNLEHYQTAIQQQREKEQLDWDKQKASYEQQLRELRDVLAQHQQAHQRLQHENQQQVAREKELDERCSSLQDQLKTLQSQLTEQWADNKSLKQRIKELQTQCDKHAEVLTAQMCHQARLEADRQTLSEKAIELKQHNKALETVNRELIEKNAFLSGQLQDRVQQKKTILSQKEKPVSS